MATIVEYTDRKPPQNRYPKKIVSPTRSGPCCYSEMEEIGMPQETEQWEFRYKRCRKCGFTIRVILRQRPDAALAARLRETLAHAFQRNIPL
jgi:hypothetical protein